MTDGVDATPGPERLDATQARILGSLVEKEATTPESYPLTANAVQLACNQKTARDPVLELDAGEVGHALRALEARRLVRSVHGARAQRYEHRFAESYSVTRQQQALLATLLLRGARRARANRSKHGSKRWKPKWRGWRRGSRGTDPICRDCRVRRIRGRR